MPVYAVLAVAVAENVTEEQLNAEIEADVLLSVVSFLQAINVTAATAVNNADAKSNERTCLIFVGFK